MNYDKLTLCREQLEQMPTERLDEILHAELKEEPPDGDFVCDILDVLKERERGKTPEKSVQIHAAWKRYLDSENPRQKGLVLSSWFLKAVAAVAVVCVLMLAIPQSVEAEGIFLRLARWTDSFFQLLRSEDQEERTREYAFSTDNSGLQQVYDAVTELGITQPVVPMWLPGDGELAAIEKISARDVSCVVATFSDSENEAEYVLLQIKQYTKNAPSEYTKDTANAEIYEVEGMEYHIVPNDGKWAVICVRDNLEFFALMDCREDDLYRMIDSIYMMEAN